MASAFSLLLCWRRAFLLLLLCGLPLLAQTTIPPTTTTPLPTPTVGSAAADFSLSLTAPPSLLQRGDSVTLTAIVASLGGFNDTVTLSVQGTLPAGVAVTFTPATVTPIAPKPTWPATISSAMEINTGTVINATTTARLTPSVPSKSFAAAPSPAPIAWAAVPMLAFAGLAGWRRRGVRLLLAGAVLAVLPLAGGCGLGVLPPQTPGGIYTINVLATASSGQQHVVPLLVRVSQ